MRSSSTHSRSAEKKRLIALRSHCRSGKIGYEELCYQAACEYLSLARPARAVSLLETIDPQYRTREESPRAVELLQRARNSLKQHPIRCSVTMIVRNEEKNIIAALDSIDEIADEIIVCDTGSTDRTIERARLFGAAILDYPWQNSFSAARNVTLAAASGTWIFWIDADDRLAPDSIVKVSQLIASTPAQAYAVRVVNRRPGNRGPEFMQVRIFPRREDLRFERSVHEQILPSLKRAGLRVENHDSVRILHTGYESPTLHRKKAARNRALIEQELLSSPNDPSLLLSLGDCHTVLDNYPEAIATYARIYDDPEVLKTYADVYTQALFYAGWLYKKMGNPTLAKKALLRCTYVDKTRIEALHLLGVLFFEEKRYEPAYEFLELSTRIKPPLRPTATDRQSIVMESMTYMIRILTSWGNYDQAELLARAACKAFPQVVEFYSLQGNVLLAQGSLVAAAEQYMFSISLSPANNPDAFKGMAEIYLKLGQPQRSIEFLQRAVKSGSRSAELHALMGDLFFVLSNPESAIESYQSALSLGLECEGHRPQLWKALSSALEAGDNRRACLFAQKMLDDDPDNSQLKQLCENVFASGDSSALDLKSTMNAHYLKSGIGTAKPYASHCR